MPRRPQPRPLAAVGALLTALALLALATLGAAPASAKDAYPPTPGVACDKGSLPETVQGRVSLADVNSGRAAKGYTCNARPLGHFGDVGGFRVERYVDSAGHECAYYDTTLLIGRDALQQGIEGTGVYVIDMTDPAQPKHVNTLRTAAMNSPHESLRLNQKRGLLAAVLSTPAANVGVVDLYDVTADCRNPVLKSSTPFGILGHESGFAPDGNTLYVSSLYLHTLAAVDVSNPAQPSLVWASYDYSPHGMSVSDDGNRLYIAEANYQDTDYKGLTILDVTQVQQRKLNPSVPVVSKTTWPNVGTPQYVEPFTVNGHPYAMEVDEYGKGARVGAGRIIDLADEKAPKVVSNMRLAVHQEAAQTGEQTADPGATLQFQGYKAHYCTIPTRVNPTTVVCSYIVSGMRVFDITDVRAPQEIAYYNAPVLPSSNPVRQGAFAMAAPVYIPERREVWYSDGNLGFNAVRLSAAAKRDPSLGKPAKPEVKPADKPPAGPTGTGSPAPAAAGSGGPGRTPLAHTGLPTALPLAGLLLALLGGLAYGRQLRSARRTS